MTNEKRRFSSLENALRVLELFTIEKHEFQVKEIADDLGIANSTAHRLLSTLREEGFIVKDLKTNSYSLGGSILALGSVITSNMELYQESTPVLKELVSKSKETSLISVLLENKVCYVNKVDCEHPIMGYSSYIGKTYPACRTSSGKVLLAYQPQDKIFHYLEENATDSGQTIDQFKALLKEVRLQGYALSINEQHSGVTSIAAPVRDQNENVTASIEITGPSRRLNRANIQRFIRLVKNAGDHLSERMAVGQ